ncbi:MAG TPA: SDR family NAD(P)-dependent oxidoreductase [Chryseosolibacter sp.]
MHFYIITGASRGLGEAVAKKLLGENNQIYCLSRTFSRHLITLSEGNGTRLSYIPCDLSNIGRANETLQHILEEIRGEDIESITLINNAGRIDPIRPIDRCDENEIIKTFNVNLLAPVIFTSSFVRSLSHLDVKKTIINISSTASKKIYDGLSCYISSKAALSQFTRCVEEEQKQPANPVKMILFEPGSMDTRMQEKVVQAAENRSASVLRFRRMR